VNKLSGFPYLWRHTSSDWVPLMTVLALYLQVMFLLNLMFMVPYILVIYIYIFDCKSNEMHINFLCILYYTTLALRVSGASCTHHQEYKLQSTAVGTRDFYGVLGVG
jgi:hypothetical protein